MRGLVVLTLAFWAALLVLANGRSAASASAAPQADPCPDCARSILFIGNSYTMGAFSAVESYRPADVTDLNRRGLGGVPALFKRFSDQAGLRYRVSVQAESGQSLQWHWQKRRTLVDREWDHVVLQELSTLDPRAPGDPATYVAAVARFARLFAQRNPAVEVSLVATWSRPDLVYAKPSRWRGKPLGAMADDLEAAGKHAASVVPHVRGVLPVGRAFLCAVTDGTAAGNPYGKRSAGQVNLWAPDNHHASVHGYYLEALVIFGGVTGVDPRTLGEKEQAARDLGIAPVTAMALQQAAREALRGRGCGTAPA
jgi:hypothetical protein